MSRRPKPAIIAVLEASAVLPWTSSSVPPPCVVLGLCLLQLGILEVTPGSFLCVCMYLAFEVSRRVWRSSSLASRRDDELTRQALERGPPTASANPVLR